MKTVSIPTRQDIQLWVDEAVRIGIKKAVGDILKEIDRKGVGKTKSIVKDSDPVSMLGLSVRAENVCLNNNLTTIGELCSASELSLLRLRNCSNMTVRQIRWRLAAVGKSLA